MHKYQVGDTVKVYEDPITQKNFEGRAVVVKQAKTEHYYQVQFLDKAGNKYYRFVY